MRSLTWPRLATRRRLFDGNFSVRKLRMADTRQGHPAQAFDSLDALRRRGLCHGMIATVHLAETTLNLPGCINVDMGILTNFFQEFNKGIIEDIDFSGSSKGNRRLKTHPNPLVYWCVIALCIFWMAEAICCATISLPLYNKCSCGL